MSSKKKFDPRKMMALAVKVMQDSIRESRSDGKMGPLVGAVLIKKGGNFEKAYRGELREGDHAEFTLLERKNCDSNLEGSVLFVTLEPCAPGSRNHPKLSCAERIVNARIKEVWVGIEDPDPTVDRKGIQYLQNNGVTVRLFDRDLQEKIQEANQPFIEQAKERAELAKEEVAAAVVLSDFEKPLSAIDMSDLDKEALKRYCEVSKIKSQVGTAEFNRRLHQEGVLVESKSGPAFCLCQNETCRGARFGP